MLAASTRRTTERPAKPTFRRCLLLSGVVLIAASQTGTHIVSDCVGSPRKAGSPRQAQEATQEGSGGPQEATQDPPTLFGGPQEATQEGDPGKLRRRPRRRPRTLHRSCPGPSLTRRLPETP